MEISLKIIKTSPNHHLNIIETLPNHHYNIIRTLSEHNQTPPKHFGDRTIVMAMWFHERVLRFVAFACNCWVLSCVFFGGRWSVRVYLLGGLLGVVFVCGVCHIHATTIARIVYRKITFWKK